jgi:hypothetical protein
MEFKLFIFTYVIFNRGQTPYHFSINDYTEFHLNHQKLGYFLLSITTV